MVTEAGVSPSLVEVAALESSVLSAARSELIEVSTRWSARAFRRLIARVERRGGWLVAGLGQRLAVATTVGRPGRQALARARFVSYQL